MIPGQKRMLFERNGKQIEFGYFNDQFIPAPYNAKPFLTEKDFREMIENEGDILKKRNIKFGLYHLVRMAEGIIDGLLPESMSGMYDDVFYQDIRAFKNIEDEIVDVHCSTCGYTGSFYKDELGICSSYIGFHDCIICGVAAVYKIPYPLFNIIKELANKNYIPIDCQCNEGNEANEKLPHISISFEGHLQFPYIPENFAIVHSEDHIGVRTTTIFTSCHFKALYDKDNFRMSKHGVSINGHHVCDLSETSIIQSRLKKEMLSNAITLFDWVVSLPKLEEKRFSPYDEKKFYEFEKRNHSGLSYEELLSRLEEKTEPCRGTPVIYERIEYN